jgi:ketosteroid isomerase-like protein
VRVEPRTDSERAAYRTALAFNDAISRRDLVALRSLITDDHAFIDSDGNVWSGMDEVLNAWRGFFEAFPDYRNVWADLTLNGDVLIAIGHSICATEAALDGPAIWAATIRGTKVSVWRVYEDTLENRSRLGLDLT